MSKLGTLEMREGNLALYPHIVIGGVALRITDWSMSGGVGDLGEVTVTMRLTEFDVLQETKDS
jgi:hypothetical protein